MAHIVARQAGYRTLEINASDDRSANTVSTRIKNALDVRTALNADGKPTCVVIDEIDGAGGGGDTVSVLFGLSTHPGVGVVNGGLMGFKSFVRTLIKLIQDVPARRKSRSNTQRRAVEELMGVQPTRLPNHFDDRSSVSVMTCEWKISIGADKKIRFNFTPFTTVCKGDPIPKTSIAVFSQTSARDLRARNVVGGSASLDYVGRDDHGRCAKLFKHLTSEIPDSDWVVLMGQFIKSKTLVVTDEAIKSSAVGLKDSGTTLQTVWNDLFIPLAAKVRRKTAGIDDGRYVTRLMNSVQACGDYDKVVQGLFEHYPNLKPLDASLTNVCKMHDWLGYYDRISSKIDETQEYELMGYLPFAIVPWYSHMSAPANSAKPAEWPKADYEVSQEVQHWTRELIDVLMSGMTELSDENGK